MSGWPVFDEEQINAVSEVLRSGKVNYWTGQIGRTFEKEFAAASGAEYAIALANGTVALELALLALGIGEGDEVVVTPRSFIASASAVSFIGATPVFADVDPDSQNLTPETVKAVLTPKTRAVILVHLGGWPCDMDGFRALADARGLALIEDCAQAHGARYKGRPVGGLSDVAAFSFCQDKIITTGGEGGMLVTNDQALWDKAWALKDHGKSFDAVYNREHKPGFRWLHETIGTNWRMTEMQSAIGRIQLGRLSDWRQKRTETAHRLAEAAAGIPAYRAPLPADDIEHAFYRFYLFVQLENLAPGWDRDRIMNAISAEGVPCFSGSCSEIYKEKAFSALGLNDLHLPIARELGETSLAFLVHPTLTGDEIERCGQAIRKVGEAASTAEAPKVRATG
jgi:dTDP-4-amino-4,6-dideoxygalactose transaminase